MKKRLLPLILIICMLSASLASCTLPSETNRVTENNKGSEFDESNNDAVLDESNNDSVLDESNGLNSGNNEGSTSAYDIWLEAGNKGSEEDFYAWISENSKNNGTASVKGITVNGKSIEGFKIVTNTRDEALKAGATKLSDAIYSFSDIRLEVTDKHEGNAIKLNAPKDAGKDGFRVFTDNGDLVMECAYKLLLDDCIKAFTNDFLIANKGGLVDFKEGEIYTHHISTIGYCSYGGAVGDGIADDFNAIKKTHSRANITGQTVVAEPGKIFNLGQHTKTINVCTDTVWSGATFIIDDSTLPATSDTGAALARDCHIFTIARTSYKNITGIKSLRAGAANVGMTFDSDMLLRIVNDNVKQYIRTGTNANSGSSMQEMIIVDKNGNVDPTTPIMWDYDTVTSATAYPLDEEPCTVTGGTFITIANQAPKKYTYFKRGISVTRSNTTVKGLTHIITGEGETGAPYNGFVEVRNAANVLFEDLRLSGHKRYWLDGTVGGNPMGTYDILAQSSVNVTWKNCTQLNNIHDTEYWGIMGSNYCKNLTYDGCKLSRFDAHKGTWNATIKNSELGYAAFTIIGGGDLIIENTILHSNNIVALREDYGATWNGDMYFKNVTLNNTTSNPILIKAPWTRNNFGYTCYLPKNIYIDGITLKTGTSFTVLPSLLSTAANDKTNPLVVTEKVEIVSNPNGYAYEIAPSTTTLYANTELVVK